MTPLRVLPSGTTFYRTYVADGSGHGDYTTIQAAINAANAQAPTAAARWLVLVAPGSYSESLTLYDYVDLAALVPGTVTVQHGSLSVIASAAICTIANLDFDGGASPVISVGSSLDGALVLYGCTMNQAHAAVDGITINPGSGGTVTLVECELKVDRHAVNLAGEAAYLYECRLERLNNGQVDDQSVVEVSGGTLVAQRCSILNRIAGYALYFSAANHTSQVLDCILRYGDQGAVNYTLNAAAASAAPVVGCMGNAAPHPTNLTQVTGFDVNANI